MGALSLDVDFAYLPELNPGWQSMTLRLIQIACIVITAGILWAIGSAFMSLKHVFSAEFPIGFICGALFVMGMVALIMWLDPSSRPRGTPEQKGFDDRAR